MHMTKCAPAACCLSSCLCEQNWPCPSCLSYLHLLKKKEEELSRETLQPRWHWAGGTSRFDLNNSNKETVTWDRVSAAMSAFQSPFGRSSPPPSSVHYGNVWRQKSSAGSLCGGWEQCDSCTARGHMAATATQSKENIKITVASEFGCKSVSNSDWWHLMCSSSACLLSLLEFPNTF